MDFIIYYIEIGIIANLVSLGLDFLIAIYLVSSLDYVEMRKVALNAEQTKTNYLIALHYLIPFYGIYLIIFQIILIQKYYDSTADSLEFMFNEMDKYKIFKRKVEKWKDLKSLNL